MTLDQGSLWPVSDKRLSLHTIAPATKGQWVLLGELSKYVTVAKARFARVEASASRLDVELTPSAVSETVSLTALKPDGDDWLLVRKEVQTSPGGRMRVRFT